MGFRKFLMYKKPLFYATRGYTLGLRPIEITRITLDDISFQKGGLTLPDRKADNPITLPVPQDTLKAIAAYVLKP